jgi:hypothetical protein
LPAGSGLWIEISIFHQTDINNLGENCEGIR